MLDGTQDTNMVHQLPDNETSLMIPSDLVTMERRSGETSQYTITFMTPHIADIVADVQEERTGHVVGTP